MAARAVAELKEKWKEERKKALYGAVIACPKCGHEISVPMKSGLTHDIRCLLLEQPSLVPTDIFEILLKRGHRIQYHSQPLASIWTVWKRIKQQQE